MIKSTFTLLFCLSTLVATAQSFASLTEGTASAYEYVSKQSVVASTYLFNAQASSPAVFTAAEELLAHLDYPELARENGREGRVVLRFVVDELGAVSQISVVRSLGFGCDEAAIAALEATPDWIPASMNGASVAVICYMPIDFRLR